MGTLPILGRDQAEAGLLPAAPGGKPALLSELRPPGFISLINLKDYPFLAGEMFLLPLRGYVRLLPSGSLFGE